MMMAVIILLVLVSSFYTDIIGVHAIFGGFLVGLIIPHEHGFAVKVTEKIEDFISALFLPLVRPLFILLTEVLRTFRIENKYRITGQWDYLGIYHWSDPHCIVLEDRGKQFGCSIKWHGMARIVRHWSLDEL